jgi:uncharacterized protein (TIGR02266 family)
MARLVQLQVDSWPQYLQLYDSRLSKGGVTVGLVNPPAQGSPLTVRLRLPQGQMLEWSGTVMQTRAADGGRAWVQVQFTDWERQAAELARIADGARGQPPTPPAQPSPRGGPGRCDLEAEITLESEHNFYTGFTQNISSGGLFIQTAAVRPLGSTFRVRFSLPGLNRAVESTVTVRWTRECGDPNRDGMGVQFTDLSSEAKEAINRFVREREPIFYLD